MKEAANFRNASGGGTREDSMVDAGEGEDNLSSRFSFKKRFSPFYSKKKIKCTYVRSCLGVKVQRILDTPATS